MARISELIRKIPVTAARGEMDPEIDSFEFDSRKVGPGTLFVAV
jgi:UDP-N-acetylmuramyl pentapeptide synthase